MSDHEQQVLAFVEITQADPDLAAVFLKHNDWEIEPAVEEYMNNPGRYMVETEATEADATVRQPLAPIVSRLADDEYELHARNRRGKRKRVTDQSREGPRIAEGIFDALRDLKSEEDYFKHLNKTDKPEQIKHQKKLADLYRPPHAIITRGNFDEVNEAARTSTKWLLINVHHEHEFDCLRINRDVWSKQPIQQLVRDYFVLWYIYNTTATAAPYTSYYTIAEWPHVAVLDPCTGERLAVWEGAQYSQGSALDEALNGFVTSHIAELSARTVKSEVVQHNNTTDNGEERAVKRRRLADDEEERMMAMAIMASLGSEGDVDLESRVVADSDGVSSSGSSRNNNTLARTTSSSLDYNNSNTSISNNTSLNTSSAQISTTALKTSTTSLNNNNSTTSLNNNNTTSLNNNTTTSLTTSQHTLHDSTVNNNNDRALNNTKNSTAVTPTPSSTTITKKGNAVTSDAPMLQIQLRLPSARTEPLSYSADTPLHVLLSDVAGLLQVSASAVRLSSNYPRRTFAASLGEQSLQALGIENKSVLFVDVSE